MKMIDADEAIRILNDMIKAREKNCSRSAIIEMGAFKYCIHILERLVEEQEQTS